MDRNLALEAVRVTEAAALSCARLTGRGDETAADQAAVDAMRKAFDALAIDGTVVIGEGERDEAPMLYIGEKVGCGGPKVDIALDPLEGTTICATGAPNALAVIAMADGGNLLHCPDTYMEKIAVGPAGKDVVVIGGGDTAADCIANAHRERARSVTQLDRYPPPAGSRPREIATWPEMPKRLPSTFPQPSRHLRPPRPRAVNKPPNPPPRIRIL